MIKLISLVSLGALMATITLPSLQAKVPRESLPRCGHSGAYLHCPAVLGHGHHHHGAHSAGSG
jgi:hypothetical protein